METYAMVTPLFPGVELVRLQRRYVAVSAGQTIHICFCRGGTAVLKAGNGQILHLKPGYLAVFESGVCTTAGEQEGLVLRVDLQRVAQDPPDVLKDTVVPELLLPEKFCRDGAFRVFPPEVQREGILSGFYPTEGVFAIPRQKTKALELLLHLAEQTQGNGEEGCRSEQLETVRRIHAHLLLHMEQRITIEALSRQYLINPTTLKTTFRAVYGNSIAAHIKEHRMERAAGLLKETELSIAQIARAVGYDSQSRFSAAFKTYFQMLPKDYRKQAQGAPLPLSCREENAPG